MTHLIGRKCELGRLQKFLDSQTEMRKVAVLWGLPGSGKTQLALHCARNFGQAFKNVIWINASNLEALRSSFADFANRALNKSGDLSDTTIASTVYNWLRDRANPAWLMILDGLDDPAFDLRFPPLRNYVPDCAQGSIIVTSNSANTGRGLDVLSLEILGLPTNEGVEMVLHHARIGTPSPMGRSNSEGTPHKIPSSLISLDMDDAAKIVQRFDGIPLALEAAGGVISQYVNIGDYLNEYERNYIEFRDSKSPISTYERHRTLFSALNMFHHHVHTSDACATQVLSLLSCIDTNVISMSLLRNLQMESNSLDQPHGFLQGPSRLHAHAGLESDLAKDFLQTISSDSFCSVALPRALYKLRERCLVQVKFDDCQRLSSISLHALIRQWGRERLRPSEKADFTILYAFIWAKSFLKAYGDLNLPNIGSPRMQFRRDTVWRLQTLQKKIMAVANSEDLSPPSGRYRDEYGLISGVFAWTYLCFGKHHLARESYREAVQITSWQDIEDGEQLSARTFLLRNYHGHSSWRSNDLSEARSIFQSLQSDCVRVFGPEHEHTRHVAALLAAIEERIINSHESLARARTAAQGPKRSEVAPLSEIEENLSITFSEYDLPTYGHYPGTENPRVTELLFIFRYRRKRAISFDPYLVRIMLSNI